MNSDVLNYYVNKSQICLFRKNVHASPGKQFKLNKNQLCFSLTCIPIKRSVHWSLVSQFVILYSEYVSSIGLMSRVIMVSIFSKVGSFYFFKANVKKRKNTNSKIKDSKFSPGVPHLSYFLMKSGHKEGSPAILNKG